MTVELIETASPAVMEDINRLIPQLSRSATQLSLDEVTALLEQDGIYLFFFREAADAPAEGMLTLATFLIPTGLRAIIEDVVVHESARGKGAGQALVEAAIAKAAERGCRTVDLTSRPSREAANRLYKRCGFELRETNVYRFATA